jgi:hypothetical protein
MIYKRYEFSQSLNGDKIVHIARNSAGMVIFRADSEKLLKEMIDRYWKNREHEEKLAQAAAAKAKAKKPAGLIAKALAPKTKAQTTAPKPPAPPARLTKTADGKFISKSALEKTDLPRKKSFWG